MAKSLVNRKGFSLIELVSVIAIIGILAIIGIPTYSKLKAKARAAAGMNYLAAIRAGQTSFYIEHGGYHSSLPVIGFAPLGNVYLNVGFSSEGVVPASGPPTNDLISVVKLCTGTYGQGTIAECQINRGLPGISDASATTTSAGYRVAVFFYEHDLEADYSLSRFDSIVYFLLGPSAWADRSMPLGTIETKWIMDETGVIEKSTYEADIRKVSW
tara:strand:- start:100 stop:741 length:642 start_codon:yes stop_codon:yes gene_type:complete